MAENASYDALLRDTAVALTAAGIDNARFEARLLLSRAAGLTIEQLISRGRDPARACRSAPPPLRCDTGPALQGAPYWSKECRHPRWKTHESECVVLKGKAKLCVRGSKDL